MQKIKVLKLAAIAATAASLALPGTSLAQAAQGGGAAPAPSASQAKVQALAKDYQEVAQKLAEIRETTYKANPELAEQRDAFQGMIEKRMQKNGYDADGKLEEMEGIASKLQEKDLDEAKKQELAQEFQQERQKMLNAQREVLAEPDVKKAGEKLQEDTLTAMKAQDKTTDSLLERMTRLRNDIQKATTNG